ncbi:MAG: hypothetical protein ACFCVE_11025 [Phycisphaerae bacterium]
MSNRIMIGQLLVQQGVLNAEQVEHVVRVQQATGRPFGDLAERLFDVSPQAVEDAWSLQFINEAGLCDLDEARFDPSCVALLSRRQAWQFHLLPGSRDETHLCAFTSAEDLVRAINFATRHFDEPVYFRLADREQLRQHLMLHYPVPEHMATASGF